MNQHDRDSDTALQARLQYLLDLDISPKLLPEQRLLLAILRQSVVDYFGDDPVQRLDAALYFAHSPLYQTTLHQFGLPETLLPEGVDLTGFRRKETMTTTCMITPLNLETLVRHLSGNQLKILLTMGLLPLPASTRRIGLACQRALRLAGVHLRVVGEENIPDGPAVYVANHQSSVDPLVAATLIHGEFTVVAKKEARFDPRSLVGSLLLEPAYIDRSNSEQSRATLDALVSRIRGGTSLLIFPEGTRSTTQVLGRFRKGGFHLAIQAGVPVVPIVLRNTGEILPRHGRVLRPGNVDIAVLDPIDDWTVEDLDAQVTALRDRFAATLADWPCAR